MLCLSQKSPPEQWSLTLWGPWRGTVGKNFPQTRGCTSAVLGRTAHAHQYSWAMHVQFAPSCGKLGMHSHSAKLDMRFAPMPGGSWGRLVQRLDRACPVYSRTGHSRASASSPGSSLSVAWWLTHRRLALKHGPVVENPCSRTWKLCSPVLPFKKLFALKL